MSRKPKLWWSSWAGAVGLGAVSLVMVAPWLLAAAATIMLPVNDSAGLDREVVGGPGLLPRLLALVFGVGALALPLLTVRWARKTWLGYLLLGLVLSGIAGIVGLVLMGIL